MRKILHLNALFGTTGLNTALQDATVDTCIRTASGRYTEEDRPLDLTFPTCPETGATCTSPLIDK